MDREQAYATWKSIIRHHPFFQEGGTYGFDFRTMIASGYADDAKQLATAIAIAQEA